MPNLRGASPVGRDDMGSFVRAQATSRGKLCQRCSGRDGILPARSGRHVGVQVETQANGTGRADKGAVRRWRPE